MHLREWQQRFQQGVLQGEHADNPLLLTALLSGSDGQRQQFAIYQHAYAARLIEALRSNYPALHLLLGDADFEHLGRAYLQRQPPTHASIRWFGDALADFLARQPPFASVPAIAELARFEWALRHCIDAADLEPVTAEALQAIAPERWAALQFELHPSVTVLPLQWNAPQVWRALTDGLAAPAPLQHAAHWLIYRQRDLACGWRSLDEDEVAALQCLADGGSFADICAVVAAHAPTAAESAARSAGLLRLWVEQGLIGLRDAAAQTGD